jgi:prolipoprotein diacylglyceryl transferase
MMSFLAIYWNPDPEIFSLGPIHIRYYGLMFCCAFVSSFYIFQYIFKREKIPMLETLSINIILGMFIGARLGHCLFYQPDYFLTHPLEMILPLRFQPSLEFIGYQGLASHGAAIGILIAIWYWCRKQKRNYMWLLDRIGIVVALSGMMVRFGNLMNCEIYGGETNLPWGFIFPGKTVSHHPTQIYEALSYFAIFCLLFFLYGKKGQKLYRGFLFGLFLVLLFSARFFIEFIKETQVDFEESMFLNMGQLLSLPFIIAGIIILWQSFRKKENFYRSSSIINHKS